MNKSTGHWILIAEDDSDLRKALVRGFKSAGFNVIGAGSMAETCRHLLARDFSLLVLDIGLSEEEGFSIAKHDVGIVMLTGSRRKKADQIRYLNEGADACVSKPIDIDLLTAIVRSILRRLDRPANKQAKRRLSDWHINMDSWMLTSPAGAAIRMSHAERLVVSLLATSRGKAITRNKIISKLTRDTDSFNPRRLEMLILRLRRKIKMATSEQFPLSAVRGVGYVLSAKA